MLALSGAPASAASIDEKQVDDYLQAFLQMTLWDAGGFGTRPRQRPAINKLTKEIRVRFKASGYEEYGQKTVGEMAALAGLNVKILSSDDETENLLIEIAHFTHGRSAHVQCQAGWDLGAQGQRRGHIIINPLGAMRRPGGFLRCFHHETMHVLGFGHSHDHATVMSYARNDWEMTPLDRLMIRTLYDSRVKQGMGWLPALAAARTALTDTLIAEGAPAETATMGRQWVTRLARLMIDEAEAGNVLFQAQLGTAYTFGEATEYLPKDEAVGYAWFRRAAEAGHRDAQANVGVSLMRGRGVAANPREAVRWLQLASNQGHASAQYNLALAYRDGNGVARDPTEAYKWVAIAANRNLRAARTELAEFKRALNNNQLARANGLVADWKPDDTAELTASVPAPAKPINPTSTWSIVSTVMPRYPEEARARGATGRVILLAELGIDGLPHNVRVADSAGHADLDAAGIKAVEQWRFTALMPVTAEFRFVFRPGPPPTRDEAWR